MVGVFGRFSFDVMGVVGVFAPVLVFSAVGVVGVWALVGVVVGRGEDFFGLASLPSSSSLPDMLSPCFAGCACTSKHGRGRLVVDGIDGSGDVDADDDMECDGDWNDGEEARTSERNEEEESDEDMQSALRLSCFCM